MKKENRIKARFTHLAQTNKKALIPFITTGDPATPDTVSIMQALAAAGADVIELGIPFSDPVADGAVIQAAGDRAIARGISYRDSLDAVKRFREKDVQTPVVLMGYLNPCEVHLAGFAGFVQDAAAAGVDGLILVDLSYESGEAYRKTVADAGLCLIQLVAPTTSDTRLQHMLKTAEGFVYYVSMRGVTGNEQVGQDGKRKASVHDDTEIQSAVARIKAHSTQDLPVVIGFGISDATRAAAIAPLADGVVIGSALVKKLHQAEQDNKTADAVTTVATQFIQDVRHALDSL